MTLLGDVLPASSAEYNYICLQTRPRRCRSLVYVRSKNPPRETVVSQLHLLEHRGVLLYGLELRIHESPDIVTLFVSKADTTGYAGSGDDTRGKLSVAKLTATTLRAAIARLSLRGRPLRICLFAKAHPQYLFGLSSKNPLKHVTPDADLVRWWLRILDSLAAEFGGAARARLEIPGADSVSGFFPRDANLRWTRGDVFGAGKAAVYCIPRFDDDPKTRFLDALVHEKRAKRVSKAQFFEELQGRQEFRLGTTVGIIGVEGTRPARDQDTELVTVSGRDYKNYKNMITTNDFSTLEYAKETTQEFMAMVPAECVQPVSGTLVAAPAARPERPVAVNQLSGLVVRRKRP